MDLKKNELVKLKLSFTDIAIGLFILLFAAYGFIANGIFKKTQKKIVIFHEKVLVHSLSISGNQHVSLEPFGARMVVEVQDKKVRVKTSDCPHQICVRKGWTGLVNDPIICMPNHITIIIQGGDARYDAVTQ